MKVPFKDGQEGRELNMERCLQEQIRGSRKLKVGASKANKFCSLVATAVVFAFLLGVAFLEPLESSALVPSSWLPERALKEKQGLPIKICISHYLALFLILWKGL